MTIKSINREQRQRLSALDLSGKGGKENEIAEALGHSRNHKPLVDANCPDGILYEYKKQSGTQWFDLHKLSGLTEEQRKVSVLFFVHEKGRFVAMYQTTYQGVVDAIGLSATDWAWAKKAPAGAQVKYALKLHQIEQFDCIHYA
jgi:hypothetical protein